MTTSFHRTLKAVCVSAVLALLTACGGSSRVVDALTVSNSRIIGLGDGYNDVGFAGAATRFTVRSATDNSTGSSVVERLAVMLGGSSTAVAVTTRQSLPTSGVFSYASGTSLVSGGTNSLRDQVTNLISDVGGSFGSSDLIVIAAGTVDLEAGTMTPQGIADQIKAAAQQLIDAQAKYVLILAPLDLSKTPGGGSTLNSTQLNDNLRTAAADINRSLPRNSLLLADLAREFNLLPTGSIFTNVTTAYCSGTAGCNDTGTDYSTLFFADDYHLTPAGNLWIAQQLYTKTGVASWR